MRLALRVDDLFELAEHVHAGQHLLQAAEALGLLTDELRAELTQEVRA